MEQAKDLLKKLQLLDESTKRKIIIVATIVITVGVIYIWLAYFNGLVLSSIPQATQ